MMREAFQILPYLHKINDDFGKKSEWVFKKKRYYIGSEVLEK